MIRFIDGLMIMLCILILSACSQKEEGRVEIYEHSLKNILYLYPNFKTQPFINYNEEIILSDEVNWEDVVDGYEYQIKLIDEYKEIIEETANDYYKGRISGDEINNAGISLLEISNLTDYTVILPKDASPELESLATSANKLLREMSLAIFGDYEFVFDDKNNIVEINESYTSLDYDRPREMYGKYLKKIQEVVDERK